MKISIALATYNGDKYISEQLESFSNQDTLPDELVIFDDTSKDNTVNILQQFAKTAPFPVHIRSNTSNIGYTKNFERAISSCRGDIILLSDQDDIWLSNKISVILRHFQANSDTQLIVNDAFVVDATLLSKNRTLSSQLNSAGLAEHELHHGCCMSLRKDFAQLILPIPDAIYSHDSWINTVATRLSVRHFLREPLQLYRRHADSTSSSIISSVTPASKLKMFLEKIDPKTIRRDPRLASKHRIAQLQELNDHISSRQPGFQKLIPTDNSIYSILTHIAGEILTNKERLAIQDNPRAKRFLAACIFLASGRYSTFDNWKSFARDVLY